jgi:hypothetical protein
VRCETPNLKKGVADIFLIACFLEFCKKAKPGKWWGVAHIYNLAFTETTHPIGSKQHTLQYNT